MSSSRSTSFSDQENINSNAICRGCFISLTLVREILSEYCSDCSPEHRRSIRSLSFSIIARSGSLIDDLRANDLKFNTSKVISKIDQNKKDLSEHSKSLKAKVDNYFKSHIKNLSDFQVKITKDLNILNSKLEENLHLTNLRERIPNLKILRKIIKNKPLRTRKIANLVVNQASILSISSLISKSSVTINYKIEDFFTEPILIYFTGSSNSTLNKFQVYLNKFSNFPLTKEKNCESKIFQKTGSFIQYDRNSIYFAGDDGSWFSRGLWNINYSKSESTAIRLSSCPKFKNYSLELYESMLMMVGGNKKEILIFDFESFNWQKWLELPAVLGTTHSTRIDEKLICVGNKYDLAVYVDLVQGRLSANGQHIGKKLVFSYEKNWFIFNKNEVFVYDTQTDNILSYKHLRYEQCSVLRCPGKAKVIYPYLYFMTINKKHPKGQEFSVWRFSVISYDLVKLDVKLES
jgi:archaellum component FlaC